MVEALSHVVSTLALEGSSCDGSEPWSPGGNCRPRLRWASLVGSALCVCHTSLPGGINTVHDTMETLHMELSLTLLYIPCPLADFHLHPSTVINRNCECNGFE